MQRLFYILAVVVVCAGSLHAQLPQLIFHSTLRGEEALPAVATGGKGLISFLFNADRSKVTVQGLLTRLQGDATGVYVQAGKQGQSGDTLLSLLPLLTQGRLLAGEMDAPPALFRHLLADSAYIVVLTTAHPAGEIRGQVGAETDLEFSGILTGDQALPPNSSPAVVFGGLHFPKGADDVYFAFVLNGLSGPMTSASICEAQPGSAGPVVIDIPTVFPGSLQGLFELDEVPADFLDKCRAGRYCVVVRTASFPDGEVRGQLRYLGALCSFAPINRLQQVPPPPSSAGFGYQHSTINATLDSLTTTVGIADISPTSVRVHAGPAGMSGPVLADLLPTALAGVYRRTYPVSPAQLSDFVQNRLYAQVSTAAYPNGEIRGQLKINLRKGYAFDLCGPQVVPPQSTAALGTGVFSVDQADCYMNYLLLTDRMSDTLTGANICQGLIGQNGPALYPVNLQEPLLRGEGAIKAGEGMLIEHGDMYFVLRTAAFPNGEIRGQIRRGMGCPPISSVPERSGWMQGVEVSPVPFGSVLRVRWQSERGWRGRLMLYGVSGGQVLFSQPIDAAAGVQEAVLSVGGLPAGMYLLEAEIGGQCFPLGQVLKAAQ